jgi:methionyl-tRNA synthetase
MTSNILITTAISYTNGSPHIGHLYESVLSDFLLKSFKLFSNVKLLTGTDEHGKKIETTALSQNITPLELCNMNSIKFKLLNNKLGVNYDHFIRTTDENHKNLVTESILLSESNGDIYLDNYTGYYNVREECFVSELEAVQSNYLDIVTGKPLEKITEESYFFKLEKYKEYIKNLNQSGLVFPSTCFVTDSRLDTLKDLSISRTSFNWGIEFPKLVSEEKHIVYVWFDALLNYVTGSKLLFDQDKLDTTIHLIGKDIIWFHSVIYPAILKSCCYEEYQAKNILVHGFILDKNGIKMSKSLGNVIDVDYLLDKYPIDAIRYYLIMETSWGEDIKFNEDRLKELYNNQLIKDFGNLYQRLYTLTKPIQNEINQYFINNNNLIRKSIDQFINDLEPITKSYAIYKYKSLIQTLCTNTNKELTDKKPWVSTTNLENKIQIIGFLLIEMNKIMILLNPIIPNKINQLRKWLGWENIYNYKLNITVDKIKAFEILI